MKVLRCFRKVCVCQIHYDKTKEFFTTEQSYIFCFDKSKKKYAKELMEKEEINLKQNKELPFPFL